MLYLMDTYETEPDENGNSRKLVRLLVMDTFLGFSDNPEHKPKVQNILWLDAGLRGIPRSIDHLKDVYNMNVSEDDRLEHVQDHELEPENWDNLLDELISPSSD